MNANLLPLCVCPSRGASLAGHHDPTEQRRDGTLLLNHRPILAVEADQKPGRAQHEPGGEPLGGTQPPAAPQQMQDWFGLTLLTTSG